MKEITCHKCQNLLSPYIDSALNPEEKRRVEAHLEGCRECAREWQLMNRTVHLLHNMPEEKAPASLIPDIHRKLEKRSGFGLLQDWFDALPLRKVSYGAVSLAFVGVVTAAVVQNITSSHTDPVNFAENQQVTEQPRIVATEEKAEEKDPKTTLLAKSEEVVEEEYYPGVPPLSEYRPGMGRSFPNKYRLTGSDDRNPSTVVDLVGTGSFYQKNRSSSFLPSGFPDTMNSEREPDVQIMFFPRSEEEKNQQMHDLIHSSNWQAKDRIDSTLILVVPAENLDKLASFCSQYKGFSLENQPEKGEEASRYRLVSVRWH